MVIAKGKNSEQNTCLEIVLKEGRNRQIRRVAEQLGYPVISLHRIAIGTIKLQPSTEALLPKGCYRYLNDSEINFLQGDAKINSNQTVRIASVEEPDAF